MATDGKTTGVLDAERRRASFDATALEEIVNRGRAKAIAKVRYRVKQCVQLFPPIILSASLSVFFLLSLKLLLSAFIYPWRAQYQPLFADAPFDNQDMDAYMDYTVSFFKVDDVSFSIHQWHHPSII